MTSARSSGQLRFNAGMLVTLAVVLAEAALRGLRFLRVGTRTTRVATRVVPYCTRILLLT